MSEKPMPSILFWIFWLLVSVIGLSVGLAIGLSLMGVDWTFRPFFILIGLAIGGLLMGIGQWLLLRSRVKVTWKWILATLIGPPLGFLIGFFVSLFRVDLFIMPLVAGTFIGMLQWLSIHRKLKGSTRWILVSALSWYLGVISASSLFDFYRNAIKFDFGYGNYASLGIIIGTVVGAISGAFVESILVASNQNNSSSAQNASC